MGATRDVALNELAFRGVSINTLAGSDESIDVEASDSGIMFINYNTSATSYLLPAVAEGAGKWFWFFDAQGTAGILITAETACISGGDAVNHTTMTLTASRFDNWAIVVGDGTHWYFMPGSTGTWTGS